MAFIDCLQRKNSELFVVEGKNAANALKQVRDPKTQAIYSLQGKIPNADRKTQANLLANPVISTLILALGGVEKCGFLIEKMRFERVIILCDADADGLHAMALLVRLFYSQMGFLIQQGCIFIGSAPLYGLFSAAQSDQPRVAFSQIHRDQVLAELHKGGIESVDIRYYKGIASLNAEMLARECVNPATRTIRQLTLSD